MEVKKQEKVQKIKKTKLGHKLLELSFSFCISLSKLLDEGFNSWLNKYDYDTIECFVNNIGKILDDNNIITVLDFLENKKLIIDVLKSAKNMDPLVKSMTLDLIKVLYTLNKETKFLYN